MPSAIKKGDLELLQFLVCIWFIKFIKNPTAHEGIELRHDFEKFFLWLKNV
jgi:hypothetical protein